MNPVGFEFLAGLLPVIVLLAFALILVVHSRLRPDTVPAFSRLGAVGGSVCAAAAIFVEAYRSRFNAGGVFLPLPGRTDMAPGSLQVDRLSLFAGVAICVVAAVSALLSESLTTRYPHRSAAYHALLLVGAAAGYVVAAQHDMTTLIPGVTALVIVAVLMSAIAKTDRHSIQASLSGVVILGVILATLAYGLALLYGVTGSSDLYAIQLVFGRSHLLGIVAVALVMLALLSLAGGLPLQRWLVDIAEAVPAGVAGAIVALLVLPIGVCLMRVTAMGWNGGVWWWRGVFGAVISFTALYTGLMAARQTSVRRLAAYVISGQVAVALGGLVATGPGITGVDAGGTTATLFDLCAITATVLAVFAVIAVAEGAGIADSVELYRGLSRQLGALGSFGIVAFVGLAGLPPAGLFIGHLLVWQSAMSSGYAWLVAFLVISALVLTLGPLRFAGSLLAASEAPPADVTLARHGRLTLTVLCVTPFLAMLLVEPLLLLANSATGVLRP